MLFGSKSTIKLGLKSKENFYFISKCLTLALEVRNRKEIKKKLKSKSIDWNEIIKISTAHYVLPAFYYNLKKVDFLKHLPHDLVDYMKYIIELNKQRNKQIIEQARELNSILLAKNIRPIFLKGTGNLLADLYEDISERMVGDIDFILSETDYERAIKVLRKFGYCNVSKYKYHFPSQKHYRRLQKENYNAAVEIHKEFVGKKKYMSEFNYKFIVKDFKIINGFGVLSYANKLNLSIIANQINDNGFYYKTISLRNAYDVFLLSKKTNVRDAVNTLRDLKYPLNCFLATCYEIFNRVDSLEYNNSKKIVSYLSLFNSQFTNKNWTKIRHKFIRTYLMLKSRLNILYNLTNDKDYRNWLCDRLTSLSFYKRRLGIKK